MALYPQTHYLSDHIFYFSPNKKLKMFAKTKNSTHKHKTDTAINKMSMQTTCSGLLRSFFVRRSTTIAWRIVRLHICTICYAYLPTGHQISRNIDKEKWSCSGLDCDAHTASRTPSSHPKRSLFLSLILLAHHECEEARSHYTANARSGSWYIKRSSRQIRFQM